VLLGRTVNGEDQIHVEAMHVNDKHELVADGAISAPLKDGAPVLKTLPAWVADVDLSRLGVRAICAAEPCGGDRSLIEVYSDASGAPRKLLRLYGRCSHNPAIYFDPDGKQTEVIPEKMITPGSAEAKDFQARRDKQLAGLKKTDTIMCR